MNKDTVLNALAALEQMNKRKSTMMMVHIDDLLAVLRSCRKSGITAVRERKQHTFILYYMGVPIQKLQVDWTRSIKRYGLILVDEPAFLKWSISDRYSR
jgi:hypothetical protein